MSGILEIDKQALVTSMRNNSWVHIESMIPVHVGWDLPVYYLEHCADNEIGKPIGNLSYQLEDALNVKDIDSIANDLNTFLPNKIIDADIFLSFAKRSTSHPAHVDYHNVLLWQIVGKCDLVVYQDDFKIKTTLQPGDLAFIPWFLKHEVQLTGARATVSFGLETPEGIEDEETA